MWKKVLIGAGLTLCFAACASTRSAPGAATSTTAAPTNLPRAGCVPSTATRIPLSPGECAGFGHTWTQEDIKRTGASDSGQALRLLDPTLSVSGR